MGNPGPPDPPKPTVDDVMLQLDEWVAAQRKVTLLIQAAAEREREETHHDDIRPDGR